jgi:putative toxin-antitoxin system antitoxin component (TIGR02293 family)
MQLAINDVFTNKKAFLKVVTDGIQGSVIKELVSKHPQYRNTVVSALGVTSSNLSRLYNKALNKQQTEEILDLLKVRAQATTVFADEVLADEWLATAIPALNGEVPNNLLDTFVGRSMVSDILATIECGEFT